MFGNFFKKLFGNSELKVVKRSESDLKNDIMKKTIAEQKKKDPLIGVKIGSKEIVNWLIEVMKDDQGVHAESLFCALGSLAGYACQAGVRAELVQLEGQFESKVFTIAKGADGKNYYFGDLLNQPLAESEYSIWNLTAGAAKQIGAKEFIDVNNIFSHVANTVGSDQFGIPRIPAGRSPSDLPINYLKNAWPHLLPLMKQYCDGPSEWPIICGLAIQEAIYNTKGVIDPFLAQTIVMECAIPMSKVEL